MATTLNLWLQDEDVRLIKKSPINLKNLTGIHLKTNLSVLKGRLIDHTTGIKRTCEDLWEQV